MACLTFTIDAPVPLTMDDYSFKLEIDGGDGPMEGDFIEVTDSTLTVTVTDAAAGSGSVMISQGTLDVDGNLMEGKIVNNTEGNTIQLTYTADGEIGEKKKITVTVPDGWSVPTVTADMQGTFTTKHYLKLADDDADGMPDAGTSLADASTMKAMDAADDAMDMIMVATVADEASLMKGDMVVFTYTGMSPEMPEASQFITEYDSMQVEGDTKVIVQSAEGASMLALSTEEDSFIYDNGGALTVTVKLVSVADDGTMSEATSDDDVEVTLTASSGTIASMVTIEAGAYMATATLTATAPADIMIDASTDAEGIAAADTLTVEADTNNLMIDAASIMASPMYAREGVSVTVTAEATANQDATFTIESIIHAGMSMDEGEPGSAAGTSIYSGSTGALAAGIQDGKYDITVSINGESETKADALTVDNTMPTVTASTDAADTVANGDTITITAMADDGENGSGIYKVMANVSALDTTQGDVELDLQADGSYSKAITIAETGNEAGNDPHDVVVTATDMAGNESEMVSVSVTLQNTLSFTSTLPAGASAFHVPLMEEGLNTVSDLATKLGGSGNVNLLITTQDGGVSWQSGGDNADLAITADLGIIVMIAAETTVTFTGNSWGDSMINLQQGSNLVGLPVNPGTADDPLMVSEIAGLFDPGVVLQVHVISGGDFQLVAAAGDPATVPLRVMPVIS